MAASVLASPAWSEVTPPEPTAIDSPLNENAALGYWKAFAQLPDVEAKAITRHFEDESAVNDDVRQLVTDGAAAIDLLHRATRHPRCAWGHDWDSGWSLTVSNASKARMLVFMTCLRARVRAADGDAPGAIADLAAAMRLAHDVGTGGTTVELLTEVGCRTIVIEQAKAILDRLSPEQRQTLLSRIESLPPTITTAAVIANERQLMGRHLRTLLDERRLLADADKHGLLAADDRLGAVIERLESLPPARRREAVDRYETVMDRLEAAARQPRAEVPAALAAIESDLDRRREAIEAGLASESPDRRDEAAVDFFAVELPLAADQVERAENRYWSRLKELRQLVTDRD